MEFSLTFGKGPVTMKAMAAEIPPRKSYHYLPILRWGMPTAGLLISGLGIYLVMGVWWPESFPLGTEPGPLDPTTSWIYIGMGSFTALFAPAAIAEFYFGVIHLVGSQIEERRFGFRVVTDLKNYESYCLSEGGGYLLLPKSSASVPTRSIDFSKHEAAAEIKAWIEAQLPFSENPLVLREQASQKENSDLGLLPQEKTLSLKRARWIARALNALGGFLILAQFSPWGGQQLLVLGAAVLFPFLLLFLIFLMKGALALDASSLGKSPHVFPVFILISLSVLARAILDFHILSWESLILPTLALGFFLSFLAMQIARELETLPGSRFFLRISSLAWAVGAALFLNAALPSKPVQKSETQIVESHQVPGLHVWQWTLSPWGPFATNVKIRVDPWTAVTAPQGSVLQVEQFPGALGIPFATYTPRAKSPP